MRKLLLSIVIALCVFTALQPMRARAEGGDEFRLDEKGTVTIVSPSAVPDGISSLGISSLEFSLSVEAADAAKVEFQFEAGRAEILEYRYDGNTGRLNIYVAGTEALFGEGVDSLVLGKVVVLDGNGRETAANVSVVEGSFQYVVYGTELKTVEEMSFPGVVQINADGETPQPPMVTPEPATPQPPVVTPEPATPQPPVVTPAPATSQPSAATPAPATPQPPVVTPAPATPQPPAVTPAPATPQPPAVTTAPATAAPSTAAPVPATTVSPVPTPTQAPAVTQAPAPTPEITATPETTAPPVNSQASGIPGSPGSGNSSPKISAISVIVIIVIIVLVIGGIIAYTVIKRKKNRPED